MIIEISSTGERVEAHIVEDDPTAPLAVTLGSIVLVRVHASAAGGEWWLADRGSVATRTRGAGGPGHHGSGAVII